MFDTHSVLEKNPKNHRVVIFSQPLVDTVAWSMNEYRGSAIVLKTRVSNASSPTENHSRNSRLARGAKCFLTWISSKPGLCDRPGEVQAAGQLSSDDRRSCRADPPGPMRDLEPLPGDRTEKREGEGKR